MKKTLVLLTIIAGLVSLNSCCSGGGSAPSPIQSAPVHVAPVK